MKSSKLKPLSKAVSPITRVLLIESDLHSNETLQAALTSFGLEVFITRLNGNQNPISDYPDADIIIFDANGLTTEGYQRCSKIREISQAPLLVLSTLDQPEVIAKMLDCGADDFITKPVSAEVLLAHIKKLTRRAYHSKAA